MEKCKLILVFFTVTMFSVCQAQPMKVISPQDFQQQVSKEAAKNQADLTNQYNQQIKAYAESQNTKTNSPSSNRNDLAPTKPQESYSVLNNNDESALPTETDAASPPETNQPYTGFGTGDTQTAPPASSKSGNGNSGGFNIKY